MTSHLDGTVTAQMPLFRAADSGPGRLGELRSQATRCGGMTGWGNNSGPLFDAGGGTENSPLT